MNNLNGYHKTPFTRHSYMDAVQGPVNKNLVKTVACQNMAYTPSIGTPNIVPKKPRKPKRSKRCPQVNATAFANCPPIDSVEIVR